MSETSETHGIYNNNDQSRIRVSVRRSAAPRAQEIEFFLKALEFFLR